MIMEALAHYFSTALKDASNVWIWSWEALPRNLDGTRHEFLIQWTAHLALAFARDPVGLPPKGPPCFA